MAVTYMTGFEGGAGGVDNTGLTGTAAYDTVTVRTGARSVRCNPASGASGRMTTGAIASGYLHFGLRLASLPSLNRRLAGGANDTAELRLTSAGELAVYSNNVLVGTSAALSLNTWYWIGLRRDDGVSVVCLQIDGATSVTATLTAFGGTNTLGFGGTEASAVDAYFDDVIYDNAGFLASSKVEMLVPISDNARATLWTGGIGGTTSLFDAVDNKPPAGTATETNTSQIEHAGGAAGTTDAYDANMTTYTSAGIGSGDTVLAVQSVAAHGEDVTTGTKLLAFSVVSNPAIASAGNVTAGDDGGGLGTYPTLWGHRLGTISASPSVTLGTSPVMRALRPETATRVASVCFMGMIVAWTPAAVVVSRVPYSTPYPQLLAH